MEPAPVDPAELGERLAAHASSLRLLVEHLAGRAVRSRVDPDDLVQEVYLRALARPGDVPGPELGDAAFRRWLQRVARNVVIDVARAIRAAKRDRAESPLARSDWSHTGLHESHLAARAAGPATRASGNETERRLVLAFRDLAADHRRVLGLRQFEGLSAAETGQRMGRSEAAVHSLYRRALQAWEEGAGPVDGAN